MSGFQEEMAYCPKRNALKGIFRDVISGPCVIVSSGRIEIFFDMTDLGFKSTQAYFGVN
jgi:hypothetical protein